MIVDGATTWINLSSLAQYSRERMVQLHGRDKVATCSCREPFHTFGRLLSNTIESADLGSSVSCRRRGHGFALSTSHLHPNSNRTRSAWTRKTSHITAFRCSNSPRHMVRASSSSRCRVSDIVFRKTSSVTG